MPNSRTRGRARFDAENAYQGRRTVRRRQQRPVGNGGAAHDPSPSPAAADLPWARRVTARYLDARARGLAREAALREAAALPRALRPALPPRRAEEIATDIVARLAP